MRNRSERQFKISIQGGKNNERRILHQRFQPGSNSEPDFICQNHGSIFLLIPRSAPATTWIEENLPSDGMTLGDGVVIEPRYVWAILAGLQDDGLTVVRG